MPSKPKRPVTYARRTRAAPALTTLSSSPVQKTRDIAPDDLLTRSEMTARMLKRSRRSQSCSRSEVDPTFTAQDPDTQRIKKKIKSSPAVKSNVLATISRTPAQNSLIIPLNDVDMHYNNPDYETPYPSTGTEKYTLNSSIGKSIGTEQFSPDPVAPRVIHRTSSRNLKENSRSARGIISSTSRPGSSHSRYPSTLDSPFSSRPGSVASSPKRPKLGTRTASMQHKNPSQAKRPQQAASTANSPANSTTGPSRVRAFTHVRRPSVPSAHVPSTSPKFSFSNRNNAQKVDFNRPPSQVGFVQASSFGFGENDMQAISTPFERARAIEMTVEPEHDDSIFQSTPVLADNHEDIPKSRSPIIDRQHRFQFSGRPGRQGSIFLSDAASVADDNDFSDSIFSRDMDIDMDEVTKANTDKLFSLPPLTSSPIRHSQTLRSDTLASFSRSRTLSDSDSDSPGRPPFDRDSLSFSLTQPTIPFLDACSSNSSSSSDYMDTDYLHGFTPPSGAKSSSDTLSTPPRSPIVFRAPQSPVRTRKGPRLPPALGDGSPGGRLKDLFDGMDLDIDMDDFPHDDSGISLSTRPRGVALALPFLISRTRSLDSPAEILSVPTKKAATRDRRGTIRASDYNKGISTNNNPDGGNISTGAPSLFGGARRTRSGTVIGPPVRSSSKYLGLKDNDPFIQSANRIAESGLGEESEDELLMKGHWCDEDWTVAPAPPPVPVPTMSTRKKARLRLKKDVQELGIDELDFLSNSSGD